MSLINNLKNPTTRLLINHAFCHLMLIPAFIYGEWWMFLLSFLWWQVIAMVSISAGYHRYYSHKSFKAGKFYEVVVNFLGFFSGAGPALTWAAVHKQHHAYSDTPLDPHSYAHKGWFAVYVNTWGYNYFIKRKFIKTLLQNKILMWFYKYFYKINLAIVSVMFLIDPLFMIFGYAIPVVFAFHGYGILNILGHKDAKPTNSWVANLLTAGEGWHANHHRFAAKPYIGIEWWQFDPTKHFIELIRKKDTV
jgi:stearoyl-CoA desaturase (delta-9 desaturase)